MASWTFKEAGQYKKADASCDSQRFLPAVCRISVKHFLAYIIAAVRWRGVSVGLILILLLILTLLFFLTFFIVFL